MFYSDGFNGGLRSAESWVISRTLNVLLTKNGYETALASDAVVAAPARGRVGASAPRSGRSTPPAARGA